MAAIPALMMAGIGVQAIGGAVQGFQNAEASESNARLARQQSRVEANRIARDRARRLGALRAVSGASGVTFSGSPLSVLADEAAESALDIRLARFGGRTRAANFENQATSQRFGAAMSLLGGGIQAGGVHAMNKAGFFKMPDAT